MFLKLYDKISSKLTLLKFKLLYGKRIEFGKNVNFRGKVRIRIDKNAKLVIKDNCFFNNGCSINVKENVVIGKDTIFGEDIKIYDHNHVFNKETLIRKSGYCVSPITIGDNTWICSNVVILKGVTIGDNCVIAANEIVKENIKDNILFVDGKQNKIKNK